MAEQLEAVPDPGQTAGDYDLLPYPSMPMAHTQPARLAALATLFGIPQPDAERARVLELGCAAGGNIIPLAVRFPHASFTGIDLARRHIGDGNARVAKLGLENVSLRRGDLTTLDLGGAQFDYVICHGVFSWVPKATQDAIFRLCERNLAPNGVATISYNVLPGWHLRMVIRDLCLRYAGTEGSPLQRASRARAALEKIAAVSDGKDPYGLQLRTEAQRLKRVPASYILGEFLAPDNAPCSVKEFIGRTEAANMDYLCEVDLFSAVPHTLDPSLRNRITSFDITNRADAEQDIDFLTGRLFRRSVLVRRQAADQRAPTPRADCLKTLHVVSQVRLDASKSTDALAVFTDDRGRPISTKHPAVRQALTRLERAYPATLPVEDLAAAGESDNGARVRDVLYSMVLAGRAELSSIPVAVGRAEDPRPRVTALARLEAAEGQPWLTNQIHVGVPAHPLLRTLLPHLDGAHDQSALRRQFATALRSGAIQVPEIPSDQPPPSAEQAATLADRYIERTLQFLARHALLEPCTD